MFRGCWQQVRFLVVHLAKTFDVLVVSMFGLSQAFLAPSAPSPALRGAPGTSGTSASASSSGFSATSFGATAVATAALALARRGRGLVPRAAEARVLPGRGVTRKFGRLLAGAWRTAFYGYRRSPLLAASLGASPPLRARQGSAAY